MNKWRAFVAGKVCDRPAADAPRDDELKSKRSFRAWGINDKRAKQNRIKRWRAKKGYK